jgi:hypothetical protein
MIKAISFIGLISILTALAGCQSLGSAMYKIDKELENGIPQGSSSSTLPGSSSSIPTTGSSSIKNQWGVTDQQALA